MTGIAFGRGGDMRIAFTFGCFAIVASFTTPGDRWVGRSVIEHRVLKRLSIVASRAWSLCNGVLGGLPDLD